MIVLDVRTVLATYVVNSGLCLAVIAPLWLQNRRRAPETGLWLVDYMMQFTGILLIALRGVVPDVLSIIVANMLMIGGTIILYEGLGRYVGGRPRQLPNYVILAAFTVIQIYLTYVHPSLQLRTVNVSVALLLVCARAAWLLLRRPVGGRRLAARPAGVVFAALVAISGANALVNLVGAPVNDLFRSNPDALALLAYQVAFIALTFALYLLVSRRLTMALERDAFVRTQAQAALKSSEEKFSVAFHTVPDALLITLMSDGTIIEVNESTSKMTGLTKDEMLGRRTVDLGLWIDAADRDRFIHEIDAHGRASNFESVFRKKSGETFPVIVSGQTVQIGTASCLLTVIQDATERRMAEERLRELSDRDALTGLLNHGAFYAAASERLAALGDARAALIFMDLDRLKRINDDNGHLAGDRAIVTFAHALREGFRESDVIGRLGGDEFAVLAVSRAAVSDESLVARFVSALSRWNAAAAAPYQVAGSMGIAWWDPTAKGVDLEGLISIADRRMYEEKRKLRG